jgi:hypothetical protein
MRPLFSLEILRNESAPPVALLAVALRYFTVNECSEMGPEILREELERQLSVEISDLQSDKLQAALEVLTSTSFEEHWMVFNHICHLFNSRSVDFETYQHLDPEQIAVALAVVRLIRGLESEAPIDFSDEVRAFAGQVFADYGLTRPPAIFPSALLPDNSAPGEGMDERSEALTELFDLHLKEVVAYVNRYGDQPAPV